MEKRDKQTHTRIKVSSLDKAKKIVSKKSKYSSVAHLLDVLIDREYSK